MENKNFEKKCPDNGNGDEDKGIYKAAEYSFLALTELLASYKMCINKKQAKDNEFIQNSEKALDFLQTELKKSEQ